MSAREKPTGCVVFANGDAFFGAGFGASGSAVGELCFNTAMTGYQEILTDPSYAEQIIAFTFPHIGNVGANSQDEEAPEPVVRGVITRLNPTAPSNWRATETLSDWLRRFNRAGIGELDTRRITRRVRDEGAAHVAIAHQPDGAFDLDELRSAAAAFPGLEGQDLAIRVSTRQSYDWDQMRWAWPEGFSRQETPRRHVVAVDYGAKRNILRSLANVGCSITVMPADATAEEILARNPDGVFLSNGPGDPAATASYAVPVIQRLLARDLPIFGICLGHQLLALALGARTLKMSHGHHGANHPVKELATGKVEVTSMNHGFTVDAASLPAEASETHISLFDGTNCGLRLDMKPVFSVQHHPEASPGPQDSFYLFDRFMAAMDAKAA